jgi:hypothetical protein
LGWVVRAGIACAFDCKGCLIAKSIRSHYHPSR